MLNKKFAIVLTGSAVFSFSVSAQLIVSEVDASGTDAADPVAGPPDDVECIELTNCGPTDLSVGGQLWYDDESGAGGDAVSIDGITTISAGESVIAVSLDDVFTVSQGIATFQAEFPGYTGQIATYADGSGLSSNPSNDDGATIFFQMTAPVNGDTPAFELIYPNAPADGETYQQSCEGLTDYLAPTPGSAVPEPSTTGLILIGLLGVAGVTRRRR